jgi:hypothetical protein
MSRKVVGTPVIGIHQIEECEEHLEEEKKI